jgi:hypothetical protein
MRAAHVSSALETIPVDFCADPDGCWDYDQLAQVAGFDQAWGQLSIGALTEPYAGFPDGAAVVLFTNADRCVIALVDCVVVSDECIAPFRGDQHCNDPGYDAWCAARGQALGTTGRVPELQRTDVAA